MTYIWKIGDKMIEINIIDLKKEIDEITKYINEYEEIQLNLFNQLKESTINWQDGFSTQFESKIYLDKQEALNFLQQLKSKKEVYNFIYNKYNEIGKKISCNLNNKNTVINALNNCISQANSIINQFNRIDNSFYYWEYQTINSCENKVINVRNKLTNTVEKVSRLYHTVENIEKEIHAKIKELEEIKINDFDFVLN